MYGSPFLVDFKAILLTKGIYRNDSVREPNLYYTDYEQPSTILTNSWTHILKNG